MRFGEVRRILNEYRDLREYSPPMGPPQISSYRPNTTSSEVRNILTALLR